MRGRPSAGAARARARAQPGGVPSEPSHAVCALNCRRRRPGGVQRDTHVSQATSSRLPRKVGAPVPLRCESAGAGTSTARRWTSGRASRRSASACAGARARTRAARPRSGSSSRRSTCARTRPSSARSRRAGPAASRHGGATRRGGRAGSVMWRALDRPQAQRDDLPGISAGWRRALAQRKVEQRMTC